MTVVLRRVRCALGEKEQFLKFLQQQGNHLRDNSYQERLSEDERVRDNKPMMGSYFP